METPFGMRLQALRLRAGFTQQALARAVGMSTSGIAKLEGAGQEPYWGTVLKLAEALGLTPNDFMGLPGESYTRPEETPWPTEQREVTNAQHCQATEIATAIRAGMHGLPRGGPRCCFPRTAS
jgi:transcriptional regulator with XRE-family HTH domain